MIRELVLRNWRNYENVTLRLTEGTTFVVASNGVGKTSLMEAARWALFGSPGDVSAIRVGASAAVARVEIELPDAQVLSVERTLTNNSRRPAPVEVRLDGVEQDPAVLPGRLAAAFGAEAGFLARLTMPSGGEVGVGPSALKLENHLGSYFGVDGLRAAVEQLTATLKTNQARIKGVKQTNAAATQQVGRLTEAAEQAARQAAAADAAYRTLQKRRDVRQSWEQFRRDRQAWQRTDEQTRSARNAMTARLTAELALDTTSVGLEQTLDELLVRLRREFEDTRIALAVNAARAEALEANQERLAGAHDDCPVCRRPLDAGTIAAADAATEQDLAGLRESARELSSTEQMLDARQKRIEAALAEWRGIPDAGRPPEQPASEDDPLDIDRLDAMVETAMDDLVQARASQQRAEGERDEARAADEAMRKLEALFRQEAALKVAIGATEASLTELLDETIRPLAAEVNQRWQALYPGRGDLATRADGSVSRSVQGHRLPFGAFSTGESMGVTILHRLLVAQMVTTVDFCWFDEPLEHLDPNTRRRVASLLSRVTRSGGPMKQVVVTTYEEPLARLLRERDDTNVTLIDVRQSAPAP